MGKELVRHLVSHPGQWASIVVLNRRPVADLNTLPRVSEQIVSMDSEAKLESETERILKEANVDAVFNTMGVGAPSKAKEEELRRVDLALPAAFARGAKAAGASHFGLLTAVGADASAKPGGVLQDERWRRVVQAPQGVTRHSKTQSRVYSLAPLRHSARQPSSEPPTRRVRWQP